MSLFNRKSNTRTNTKYTSCTFASTQEDYVIAMESILNDMCAIDSAELKIKSTNGAVKEAAVAESLMTKEAAVPNIFNTILNFIKEMGKKIAAIFKNIWYTITSWKKDNTEFLDKYMTLAANSKIDKVTLNAYQYNTDIGVSIAKDLNAIINTSYADLVNETKADSVLEVYNDKLNMMLVKYNLKSDDFKKSVHAAFRNGDTKQDITFSKGSLRDLKATLLGGGNDITIIKNLQKALDDMLKKGEAVVKKQMSQYKQNNDTSSVRIAQDTVKLLNKTKTYMTIVVDVYVSVMNSKMADARKVIRRFAASSPVNANKLKV